MGIDATVNVGELTFDEGNKFVTDPDNTAAVDDELLVRNFYEGDHHKYVAGLTSPKGFQGSSVAIFQLCTRTLLWICDWTAARTGAVPRVPDPRVNKNDWELLDDHFETPVIMAATDFSTPMYRVSGTYVFAAVNPALNLKDVGDDVTFPLSPWLEDDGEHFEKSFKSKNFTKHVLRASRLYASG